MEETPPPFCIGQHESKRDLPVTIESVQSAHTANYEMLTCPITTPLFHSRVLSLLSSALSPERIRSDHDGTPQPFSMPVTVPPLSPVDTPLTPDETTSQLIGLTSPWIDLTSSDPLIEDVSRQVLKLEMAYAAFCGLTCVIVPGPYLDGRGPSEEAIALYARAITDALNDGPFIHVYVWLRMSDVGGEHSSSIGDLRQLARESFQRLSDGDSQLDLFGSWETWDIIRSICNYPSRLSVALSIPKNLPPHCVQSRWYSEPVRILTLDATVFVPNAKGYPVLSRGHQNLIGRFVRGKIVPWFILCDVGGIPVSATPQQDSTMTNFLLDNNQDFPSLSEASTQKPLKDPTPHLSYMRNLSDKQPLLTAIDKFSTGYQDYLQAPLQPLTVNLESITYEVFEKDPIKYEWYERATARALHDWIEHGKPTSNPDGRVVVAVVGAGRGPLVTRALKAAEAVGVDIDLWVLEKNPNAFVLLQRHNATTWSGQANLVHSDMRTWRGPVHYQDPTRIKKVYNVDYNDEDDDLAEQGEIGTLPAIDSSTTAGIQQPSTVESQNHLVSNSQMTTMHQPTFYKIDILISELLGSFGDNELSPECLDGIQHLLSPDHGISIPCSYTAFLTPISAPKLHADISHTMTSNTPNAAEIPYVVMLNAIDYLSIEDSTPDHFPIIHPSAEPKPIIHKVWEFIHPNPFNPHLVTGGHQSQTLSTPVPSIQNAHNARHTTMTFPIPNRATCHGLAGYFESVLYPGVELSTNPNTMPQKSEDMISWFPIYFPLKNPLTIPDNSTMIINMWRQTDDRKVWYEWIVDVYIDSPLFEPSHGPSPAITELGVQNTRQHTRKRIRVGSSGLHSSVKEACLM